jgi:hypothetical protein
MNVKNVAEAWAGLLMMGVMWVTSVSAAGAPLPFVVPAGLSAGTSYQLIFVTSGTRDALSKLTSDYDAFVNQEADAFHIGPTNFSASGVPIGWHAIVSVMAANGSVSNAKATAPQVAAVYNLVGDLIAPGGAGTPLYQPLTHSPVKWSPDGSQASRLVFTGTTFTGNASTTPAGTGSPVTAGNSGDIGETWITLGFGAAGTQPAATPLALYALSNVLVVPAPEPSGALAAAGVLALRGLCGRRRPRAAGGSPR